MSTQIKIILDILPKLLYDTSDMENLNILRVIHANISDHLRNREWPYGQPGQMPIGSANCPID